MDFNLILKIIILCISTYIHSHKKNEESPYIINKLFDYDDYVALICTFVAQLH